MKSAAKHLRGRLASHAFSLSSLRLLLACCLLAALGSVRGVDRSKFRTCEKTGFCRRHRLSSPPPASGSTDAPFKVDRSSVAYSASTGSITAKIHSIGHQQQEPSSPLLLQCQLLVGGVLRLRVTEDYSGSYSDWSPRWEVPLGDVLLVEGLHPALGVVELTPSEASDLGGDVGLKWGDVSTSISLDPFRVSVYVGGRLAVSANGQGLLHFEQRRRRDDSTKSAVGEEVSEGEQEAGLEEKEVVDYGEDGLAIYSDGTREAPHDASEDGRGLNAASEDSLGMWEETFEGHMDTKPGGPMSVGMDVTFEDMLHVYGIPEHASPLNLRSTLGQAEGEYKEPYRLYTLDVFQYEMDNPMALYGTIPILVGHRKGLTAGAFWMNPTETFVDLWRDGPSTSAHWISESGVVDLFLLPGPSPADVFRQMAVLTGKPALPPLFALGFHQCRWNYKDEADVADVEEHFESLDFPYDVLWLDIEHTDGKRYFTWDKRAFPDPIAMQEKLSAHGRRMVAIVDPHIKRDDKYAVHSAATASNLYIKDKDGRDFDGWCWPGSSSYLDFTEPRVREWWASRFTLENWPGSTLNLFVWNDMNEPSVFNGPEVSMRKDCQSLAGIEHREWHNLYGMYMQRATAEGVSARALEAGLPEAVRPFVLTRSFFAGSQRWGAVWTGDNAAEWAHLKAAAPMLLAMSAVGLPFVGADVGGFFGDPTEELFTRWMQAAAYQPFFRSHAHHDSKRREPWTFGEPATSRLRAAVADRYALLPYWYTLFYQATLSGVPPMRPMWTEFPGDEGTFSLDEQWMVGPSLLVKPILEAGVTRVDVYLPGPDSSWYDVVTGERWLGEARSVSVLVTADRIPVFQRGGSIVTHQARLRRSSKLMKNDPFTLHIALDSHGEAEGFLYLDDGETMAYLTKEQGTMRHLSYSKGALTCAAAAGHRAGTYKSANLVERIVVRGLAAMPTGGCFALRGGDLMPVDCAWDEDSGSLTVRKPQLPVSEDWALIIEAGVTVGHPDEL
jgi:alpha 1,3-glucosidase